LSPLKSPFATEGKKDTSLSFQNILKDAINMANSAEYENYQDTIGVLTGEIDDLHTSMLALNKSDLALQFAMQIRNKILDAYNEIMRMQL